MWIRPPDVADRGAAVSPPPTPPRHRRRRSTRHVMDVARDQCMFVYADTSHVGHLCAAAEHAGCLQFTSRILLIRSFSSIGCYDAHRSHERVTAAAGPCSLGVCALDGPRPRPCARVEFVLRPRESASPNVQALCTRTCMRVLPSNPITRQSDMALRGRRGSGATTRTGHMGVSAVAPRTCTARPRGDAHRGGAELCARGPTSEPRYVLSRPQVVRATR